MYAHQTGTAEHQAYKDWLGVTIAGDRPVAIPDVVLSGFIRLVTHPRIFAQPTPLREAFLVAQDLRSAESFVPLAPGERHWSIFERLCAETEARGNLVTDAYLAALAIESGSELITTDRDYSRFPGLRWRHPLAS